MRERDETSSRKDRMNRPGIPARFAVSDPFTRTPGITPLRLVKRENSYTARREQRELRKRVYDV